MKTAVLKKNLPVKKYAAWTFYIMDSYYPCLDLYYRNKRCIGFIFQTESIITKKDSFVKVKG